MAYANLLGVETANRAEVFKRFRDFVCRRNGSYDYSTTGIGWTLHDAVYAVDQDQISINDYFVIKSIGESGNEDLYFKVINIANYISIIGYLYWNNTTHTGVQAYGSGSNWNVGDTAVPVIWVYGDLDAVFLLSRPSNVSVNFVPSSFGILSNPLYDKTVAVSSGALTAGTDVVIDVGTVPSTWRIGDKLFLRDNVRVDRTDAGITAKTSSTVTITLSYSYNAGVKISQELAYFCNGGAQLNATYNVLCSHAGTKGVSYSGITWNSGILGYGYPEVLNAEHLLVPFMLVNLAIGYAGELPHIYARHTSGLTPLDLHQLVDGTNVRVFNIYNGNYAVIKEV